MTYLIGFIVWFIFVALVLIFLAGANRDRSHLTPHDEYYGQDQ